MRDFTFITFATKDTIYEQYARNWVKNMCKLDLKFSLDTIMVPNDAPENVSKDYYKRWIGRKVRVSYIRDKLKELKKPIIWLDCDDALTERPRLPKEKFDFGYMKNPTKAKKRLPIIAGLLAFYPTKNAFHFLDVWHYLCSWGDLEPMGGNHIRLIHTFDICNDVLARRYTKFKPIDLTPRFGPIWKFNGNKL